MDIKQATSREDFLKCWDVVHELRPLLSPETYIEMVLAMLDEGYKMIFIEQKGKAVSFCGYRQTTMFYRGKSIYIDDLCSLPEARGKGHASALLDYVIEEAKNQRLQSIHLDSGHWRHDAHRLYLNKGFIINSHHFVMELK
jgi:GNAT superfamily N-acetyltransferase